MKLEFDLKFKLVYFVVNGMTIGGIIMLTETAFISKISMDNVNKERKIMKGL